MLPIFLLFFFLIPVFSQISVQVTPNAVNHALKHQRTEIEEQLLRFRPAPFHSTYLGLELTIDHLQITTLKMPKISYQHTSSPKTVNFKLIGGSAQLLGQYSAIYKTKREGQFELNLEHFDLSLSIDRQTFAPSDECSLEIDEAIVTMTPSLPEQITKMIRSNIIQNIQVTACQNAHKFVESVANKLPNLFQMLDISEGGLLGEKLPTNLHLLEQEEEEEGKEFLISLPESLINAELAKLYSAANTKIRWMEIPEVREMLENCDECHWLKDAELTSTLRERPSIRIKEDSTLELHLPLTTTLFENSMTISSDMILSLSHLVIHPPIDGLVDWTAHYHLKSLEVLKIVSTRKAFISKAKIEQTLWSSRQLLESILTKYISGSLPILVSPSINWKSPLHLHPSFSTSSLNFAILPHFHPKFRISV